MSAQDLLEQLSRLSPHDYGGISAVLLFVLLILQTVHWVSLLASFSFETSLPRRLMIQVVGIPLAGFLFYVLARNPHLVHGAARFVAEHAGLDIERGVLAALSRALLDQDYAAAATVILTRGLVLVAAAYAFALFLATAVLAPRVGILRNLAASVLASTLLFAAVHILVGRTAPAGLNI